MSPGRGRRREDERPGRVDEQVDDVAVGGDEPAERAQGLGERADAHEVDVGRVDGRARARRGPRRARAARRGAGTPRPASSTGASSPSIENTVSVTTSAGPSWPASSSSTWAGSVWRATATWPADEPGAVDDRRVVQLVAHHEHVGGVGEGGEHGQVGGEPGRQQQRGLGALPVGQLGLELVVDGPAARPPAARRRCRSPTARSPPGPPPRPPGWPARPR